MKNEEREAAHFGRRVARRVVAIVALGLVPVVLSFLGVDTPVWLSILAFVAAAVAAGLVARHQLQRFRCPSCRRAIRDPAPTNDEAEAPIRYFCAACNVVWDSGLRTPSGL